MNVRPLLAAVVVTAGLVVSPSLASAQPDQATGLERAREATAQGLERARGLSAEAPGQANRARGLDPDRARGLDRAAEAIERARARADARAAGKGESQGRGRGNAFGRGHAEEVHRVLDGGGSPSELAGEHSETVQGLVQAFNELKRSDSD